MSYRHLWKRDWIRTLRRVWAEIVLDDCFGASAQLAYYFLLAFFPFVIFIVTLVGFLPFGGVVDRMMDLLSGLMPDQAIEQVRRTVGVFLDRSGTLLPVSVVGALLVASNGMRAIMVTLNRAYSVREGRSWLYRYVLAIGLTMVLALAVIVGSVLLSLAGRTGAWIASHLGGYAGTVWWLMARVTGFAALIFILEVIYYLAPNVRRPWHWVTPGSIIGVVLWFAGSRGFTMWVGHFGQYETLYAGLGAVVVFLLWLYIVGLAILIGGEINAELERSSGFLPPVAVPAPASLDEAGHDRTVREERIEGDTGAAAAGAPAARGRDIQTRST